MIKKIKLDEDIGSAQEAISMAKKEAKSEVLNPNCKNYIYLEGINNSDLIIAESNKKGSKFAFRKCTDSEWIDFYNKEVI